MSLSRDIYFAIALFAVVLTIYNYRVIYPVNDSRWSLHIAMSIVTEGNTDLNEYQKLLEQHNYYAIHKVNNKYYSQFPIGVSIMALPVIYVLEKFPKFTFPCFYTGEGDGKISKTEIKDHFKKGIPVGLELFVASLYAAMAGVVIYLLLILQTKRKYAVLLTLLFAFGTTTWSTASRALWQHGPSMLMLLLALYLILLAKSKPKLIQLVSLPLAAGYVIRPTNAISVAAFSLFVFINYRKEFWKYLAWSTIIVVPFLFYNFTVYHSILPPYFQQKLFTLSSFGTGLLGTLISPARGMFIFSPVLLFAIYGLTLKIQKRELELLDYFILAIIVMHWLVVSSWHPWWGGHSYGYRFMSDMVPFLIYFIIPFINDVVQKPNTKAKVTVVALFFILALFSCFVHYRGATKLDALKWNAVPNNVDKHPERLWDWKDLQFLRGVKG